MLKLPFEEYRVREDSTNVFERDSCRPEVDATWEDQRGW